MLTAPTSRTARKAAFREEAEAFVDQSYADRCPIWLERHRAELVDMAADTMAQDQIQREHRAKFPRVRPAPLFYAEGF